MMVKEGLGTGNERYSSTFTSTVPTGIRYVNTEGKEVFFTLSSVGRIKLKHSGEDVPNSSETGDDISAGREEG